MRPSAYHPLTSDRAEPDGIENDDDYQVSLFWDKQDSNNFQAQKHKDSLEGAYDHSKEYDPFKVNHLSLSLSLSLFAPNQWEGNGKGKKKRETPTELRGAATSAAHI